MGAFHLLLSQSSLPQRECTFMGSSSDKLEKLLSDSSWLRESLTRNPEEDG